MLGALGLMLVACSEEATTFSATSAAAGAKAEPKLDASAGGEWSVAARADGAETWANAGAPVAPGAPVEPSPDASAPEAGFCTGQAVTVAELASGSVRAGKTVLLPALVASSQKFLLSASKTSGKCWWAAFAAQAGASGENSAVLLLSSAEESAAELDGGGAACTPGSDSLPDDLAPGDRIAAFGSFSEYTPSACHATASMRELLVKPGCAVTRSGHGALPASVSLTHALADRLAQGSDAALLRAWSGARVELGELNALPVAGSASVVDAYGVIRFQETALELHTKVPYGDLTAGGPRQSGKSLAFAYPMHFERVAGVLFLDYCTWALEVCDRCADLSPQSRGCSAAGG